MCVALATGRSCCFVRFPPPEQRFQTTMGISLIQGREGSGCCIMKRSCLGTLDETTKAEPVPPLVLRGLGRALTFPFTRVRGSLALFACRPLA